MLTLGRTLSRKSTASFDSGSERADGPEYIKPPRASRGCQAYGKLRLRSTPSAFCRVPAASPSGFRTSMTHTAVPWGGASCSSRRATAIPAGSLPWMQPTTSRVRAAAGSPNSTAVMGRPLTDCPRTSVLLTGTGGAPVGTAIVAGGEGGAGRGREVAGAAAGGAEAAGEGEGAGVAVSVGGPGVPSETVPVAPRGAPGA